MLNPKSTSTLAAALAAGLLLAAPQFAAAQPDAAAPEAPAEPRAHGNHPHGRGEHHGGHHGGPYWEAMKSLDLTDAQRAHIREAMKASWQSGKAGHAARRALHRQLMTTPPTAANHDALVRQVAEAEAGAARDRVLRMAALKTEIYGLLNDAQRAQLTEQLSRLPEPGAHGEKTGWKRR